MVDIQEMHAHIRSLAPPLSAHLEIRMNKLLNALLIAAFTTLVLVGCSVMAGDESHTQPYVPQGGLVLRTPTPTPNPTALVVIDPSPSSSYGVPRGKIILGPPQITLPLDLSRSRCSFEVLDLPFQTVEELLGLGDDRLVENRLKELVQEHSAWRTITLGDKHYLAYVEFVALVVRIMGGTADDQQSMRELNNCTVEAEAG